VSVAASGVVGKRRNVMQVLCVAPKRMWSTE